MELGLKITFAHKPGKTNLPYFQPFQGSEKTQSKELTFKGESFILDFEIFLTESIL